MKGKRYLDNTISSAFLQVITVMSGLIVPIIILQTYGSTLNGLMNSIKQFINYLTIVEAGLSTVSIAALYKPLAKKNYEQINEIVSASRVFYNKTGLMFSMLVVLTSWIFPYFINSEVDKLYTTIMILVIGISGTLEYFIIGKYRVLLTADQREYVITNIQAIGLILNTISIGVLTQFSCSLIVVQFISGIIYLMRAVLIKIYVNKKYKHVDFKAKHNNKVLSQRWDALIHQIAAMVVFNTDILLLTLFSTLDEVSVYSIYRMIFTAIASIVSIFTTGISPLLGNVINKSDKEFKLLYNVFENLYFIFLSVLYSVSYLLYMPFLKIYTANITDANYIRYSIMVLFLLGEALNKIRVPSNILVNINGLFKDTKNKAIIEALINLVISLILVRKWGMGGVLIGTICSYAYRTLDFILYSSKVILKRSSLISLKIVILNIVMSIISVAICKQVLILECVGYLQWIKCAVVVGLISCFMIVLGNLIFNHKNSITIIKFIKRMIVDNKKRYINAS